MIKVEVIASTLEDALFIEDCGGDRIELIMGFLEDGLTPSMALIEKVTSRVKIPVNVMVRPHAKSFIVSETDLEIMKREIEIIADTKANGIVIGAITSDNKVDTYAISQLLKYRKNLEVTYHAASNYLSDFDLGMKALNDLQITRVLNKGGVEHIDNNLKNLKHIVDISNNVIVLAGGNIACENVENVVKSTGVKEIHIGTAARVDSSRVLGVDKARLKKFLAIVKSI